MTVANAEALADAELRRAVAAFAAPQPWRSALQFVTSLALFLVGCAAMYVAASVSILLTLALALPTGALLVRLFIIQHDCGHGSFFASRRANAAIGRLCSLFTLTPYANWRRQHGQHHADWNNLDRIGGGSDIYSSCLTVKAYFAMPAGQRFVYRLVRHPLVANLALPPLVFVLLYRVPFDTPVDWAHERRSVYLTNAALGVLFAVLLACFGWHAVLLVQLSIMVVASILGVWLFTVQHRFENAKWMRAGVWRYMDASLGGSSWLDLPRVLHWFTGNIGFHHVHHLNQRVPNYRLDAAHKALSALQSVPRLGLWAGIRAIRLTLWDEEAGRLVRFSDVRRRRGGGAGAGDVACNASP